MRIELPKSIIKEKGWHMGLVYLSMIIILVVVATLVWGLVYLSGDFTNEQRDRLD